MSLFVCVCVRLSGCLVCSSRVLGAGWPGEDSTGTATYCEFTNYCREYVFFLLNILFIFIINLSENSFKYSSRCLCFVWPTAKKTPKLFKMKWIKEENGHTGEAGTRWFWHFCLKIYYDKSIISFCRSCQLLWNIWHICCYTKSSLKIIFLYFELLCRSRLVALGHCIVETSSSRWCRHGDRWQVLTGDGCNASNSSDQKKA